MDNLSAKKFIYIVLLSIPFVIVVLATRGLTKTVPTFHGSDELNYHYPTILQFYESWPRINLSDYKSATTPLFHISFAIIGKMIGPELYKLRIVNMLISMVTVWIIFSFLRRHIVELDAFLFSLCFSLSPYFWGRSFRLFTENFAFLFWLLSLIIIYNKDNKVRFILSSISLSMAVLSRQITLWFVLPLMVKAILTKQKIFIFVMLLFPALVLLPFIYIWHGLVPPHFAFINESSILNLRAAVFTLAVLGFYTIFIKINWLLNKLILFGVFIGVILVMLTQLKPLPGDDGFLWRIAHFLPNLFGGNFLFYLLFPIGVMNVIDIIKQKQFFLFSFIVAFAFSFLKTAKIFQNYYDSFILVFLFLEFAVDVCNENLSIYHRAVGILALTVCFVIYFVNKLSGEY
jgi:hypothetical protein